MDIWSRPKHPEKSGVMEDSDNKEKLDKLSGILIDLPKDRKRTLNRETFENESAELDRGRDKRAKGRHLRLVEKDTPDNE